MNIIQALLLGLIQGLTEFLPVSSSAHLVVFQSLFKLREPMLFFDVMLHLGTLMSVLIFFRADIYRLVGALAGRAPADARRWPGSVADGRRVALWVILGSVPAGIVGALFNDIIEKAFSSPVFTGIALFVTGTILIGADRARRGSRATADLSAFGALAVGAAQALAILPGISRSGSTISASIFLGL
ncbi:MAG TPA: undecaprenyl-diphosphate phosphatase, partial [bacterium]|nr:undecaprenyl-diphosphate phosphatase [bacterium]